MIPGMTLEQITSVEDIVRIESGDPGCVGWRIEMAGGPQVGRSDVLFTLEMTFYTVVRSISPGGSIRLVAA